LTFIYFRPALCFILVHNCGLTVRNKRICYAMICLETCSRALDISVHQSPRETIRVTCSYQCRSLHHSPLDRRFSNWGPRTKGGPRRVPKGSARGFRKVVIVLTVFNNLRPIYVFKFAHVSQSVTQSQCIARKCCRGLTRQSVW